VRALGDAEIHSVQSQNGYDARRLNVHVHAFRDFADCAALMLQMDEIVSVDTAALHLAGAIGHPRVFGLLSHWASWRWLAPWYGNVRLCRQKKPDDWSGALAEVGRDQDRVANAMAGAGAVLPLSGRDRVLDPDRAGQGGGTESDDRVRLQCRDHRGSPLG
jgi:hypothetical protein